MEIKSYGKSDIGIIRDNNEDFLVIKKFGEEEHLFIVADGMGGHQAGNVASKLGVETFVKHYGSLRKKGDSIDKSMLESITKANSTVLNKANSELDKRGMGTTFSALLISEEKANIVHIGDSRIYLIREGNIKKITTDHTFVEKMVDEGRITAEEARHHPQKNILYMSLGARESFQPDEITDLEVREGDIFLLCSDGLTDMVTDDVIKEYCQSYSAKKATEELISLSNKNGGLDNISLIIIHAGKIKKRDTEPIKFTGKKKGKSLFILISIFLLTLIVLGAMVLKKEQLQLNREIFTGISFRSLKFEEKKKLILVKQFPDSGLNTEGLGKFINGKTLMIKKGEYLSLIFTEDEFIAVKGGDILSRNKYRFGETILNLDSIYFDKSSNGLVAIDNEKKIYKLTIEK